MCESGYLWQELFLEFVGLFLFRFLPLSRLLSLSFPRMGESLGGTRPAK